jgi:predicted dehydrogenase
LGGAATTARRQDMSCARVGVVGCGHLGKIHARLLAGRDDCKLVGVVDPILDSASAVAEAHGCESYSDPEDLIGRVDAAVVAAPTGLHAKVAIPLLEAGIDLLIEKPIAATVEDARAIVVTARRYRRVVAVGHVERFNPAWALACQQPGKPLFVQAARLAPFTYRSLDVGVVFDLMIHDIDLVLSLQPGRLENIESNGIVATGGHEDVVKARLTFGSGLVADLMASRINPVLSRELSMWTTEAMVSVDFNAKTVGVVAASEEVAAGSFVAESVPIGERSIAKDLFFQDVLPHQTLPVPDSNAIASEHDDFLRARAEGVDPRVSASSGAAALEVATRVLDVLRCTKLGAPPAIMEIRKSA